MNTSFEMNNTRRDSDIALDKEIKATSPIVEIFTADVLGKDLSKYGKKVDAYIKHMSTLGDGIACADSKAIAELNTIRKLAVKPLLEAEIQMLGVYGSFEALGFDESIEVNSYDFVGDKARAQANNSDVVFAGIKSNKYPVGTQTVSGGWATDYRRLQLGDTSKEAEGMQQTRVDIINKMKKLIMENAYKSIKNAEGVKYFFEGAGLTKAGVDGVISKVRRLGNGVTVIGDYSLLSQFTPWAGYNSEFTYGSSRYGYTQGIAAQDLADIRAKGILGGYNGAALVEMTNPYDYATKISDGTNFDTMLDSGVGLVVPTGVDSPIKSWTKGGLTTFSGNDVTTGHVLTRFDIEFATDVTKGKEFMLGMISDTNL